MMTSSVIVYIVVDPEFGDRLGEVAMKGPVWIADTTSNRAAAERWWTSRAPPDESPGVTSFLVATGEAPEQWCEDILPTVDLHYGAYDAYPPTYDAVEIRGAIPTTRLLAHLATNGYHQITRTLDGFRAGRDPRAV